MADTAQLHTAHASGLGAVERELQALHRDRLRQGDEDRGVRLSVLTLVVACTDAAGADIAAEVVGEVGAEHPARALLLVADRRAPSGIEADLSLQCSVARGPDQVCAEIVRLTVGGEAALHLGSVVAPLLVADVPVQLWLCGAPHLAQALAPETLATCERIILDTAAYPDSGEVLGALAAIPAAGAGGVAISDLAWSRLAGWREVLARAVDGAARLPFLGGVERITVRGGSAAQAGAEVLLLAGWLGDRLEGPVRIEPGEGAGPAAVLLEARSQERRLRVEVSRVAGGLAAEVAVDGMVEAAWRSATEPPRLAELVGAAVQEQGHDPIYTAALRAAVALIR
jgi:glucose-6-phosphate dehydrogenase assembly protein OpcA